ncbi:MAG: NUC091 domain-containing protein [Monoraphidium minutum]|nr:MAG: NUC091 domain-containing protein [Monoraphidium minutum]
MPKFKKKEGSAGPKTPKPKHSNDANRATKGSGGQRDAATVRRLAMYKTRPVRDKKGKVLHEDLQSKELPTTRIQPDRRWFGNTRVIGQRQLEQFRDEMAAKVNDGYTVLLREKKLPLQLLEDPERKVGGKAARASLLATQPFGDTFGPQRRRKRPKLGAEGLEALVAKAEAGGDAFAEKADGAAAAVAGMDVLDTLKDAAQEKIFEKGQSKRIWGELYKVLDSSDVVIQVLDARDPEGTRSRFIERHIRKNARHKHLLLLLNKCDLVPAWVTKRWLHTLSREYPTLAFHASVTNAFGKGSLLSLLRQLARLRSDKKAISVGFIGYPNVGKSSVINALRTKKVCKTAPVPGETKVWQYITLMKRIFLIDCPGVVYHGTANRDVDAVLKGVVRVEGLEDAAPYVDAVLQRVKPEYLRRAYRISSWEDGHDFLVQLARLSGKLLRGGDPDTNTAARMVLYDWQRGKIPFYTLPPGYTDEAPPKRGGGGRGGGGADGGAEGGGEGGAAEGGAMYAEGVTEEDAAGEAGVRPETAGAAARAVREAAAAALAAQARGRIPIREGYYLPDDERAEGGEGEDDDVIPLSSGSEGEQGSEGEEGEGSEGGEEGESPEVSGESGSGEEEEEGGGGGSGGDDSDGYGEEGLSWEAVLQAVQVCGGHVSLCAYVCTCVEGCFAAVRACVCRTAVCRCVRASGRPRAARRLCK